MSDNMNFEKKLEYLEEIASKMESGELTLEDSLKSYEEAMAVIKECEKYVEEAKLRIEKVSTNYDEGEE